MAYNRSDVGVSSIGVTASRNTVIDYTFPLCPNLNRWMTRAPGKLSPIVNLIKTLDVGGWLFTFISIVAVSVALFIVLRVGNYDVEMGQILMEPIGMLTGESMPNWFEKKKSRAGKFILLNWSVMGMVIMFCFTCNFRAILMKSDYEQPIDTTEQLVQSGMTVHLRDGTWHPSYLSLIHI